jgi:hypothetical protein
MRRLSAETKIEFVNSGDVTVREDPETLLRNARDYGDIDVVIEDPPR